MEGARRAKPSEQPKSLLSVVDGGLEPDAVLGLALKRHAQLEQLDDDVGKVVEEGLAVLGVLFDVLLESLVLDQGHVGRQHHQALGGLVLVLLGSVPAAPSPLLLHQEPIVVVGQDRGGEGPGAVEARAVGVAPAQGVGTGQGDHLLVVEAHAAKDGADVVLVLGRVREAAVGRAEGDVAVLSAGPPRDDGALHLLHGADARQRPQVRVRDPGELLLDGLEEVAGVLQAGVGAVVRLGREPHRGAVAAAGARGGVVRPRRVPREAQQHGTVRPVVVVILLPQLLGDGVVDLLVIFCGGLEQPGRLACAALGQVELPALRGVEVEAARESRSCHGSDDEAAAGRGLGRFGTRRVMATRGLLEELLRGIGVVPGRACREAQGGGGRGGRRASGNCPGEGTSCCCCCCCGCHG